MLTGEVERRLQPRRGVGFYQPIEILTRAVTSEEQKKLFRERVLPS